MESIKHEHPNASSTFQSDPRGNCTEIQKHPVGYPYHAYEAARVEPYAVHPDGYIMPVHMLTCGHLVAIDSPLPGTSDNRCGLNCLHVAHWIKQQDTTAKNANLRTGASLGQALISSSTQLPITKVIVLPTTNQHQSHDNIYCEICHGLPASSYFIVPRRDVRRALAFTRPVIEHFTGLVNEQIVTRLCKLFYNHNQLGYDWKLTHILRCGHQVWAQPARPCAANCSDTPECKSRIFPGNNKQGDVIFCHECVYRAEMVYERYARVGGRLITGPESQTGLQGILVPGKAQDIPQPQVGPTYGVADPASGDYREYPAADGFPFDLVSEEGSAMSSSGP